MHTKPAAVHLPRQYDCSAARAIEGLAVLIETRAGPGSDRDRHCAIRRRHDHRVRQVKTELRRAWPDIVPLPLGPCRQAFHQLLVGAEDHDVRVAERTRRRIIYVPHEGGEAVKPVAYFGRRGGIGLRQGQVHMHLLLSSLSAGSDRLVLIVPLPTGSIPTRMRFPDYPKTFPKKPRTESPHPPPPSSFPP